MFGISKNCLFHPFPSLPSPIHIFSPWSAIYSLILGWLVLAICSSRILADPVVVVVHLNVRRSVEGSMRMCRWAGHRLLMCVCVCVCHVSHHILAFSGAYTLHGTLFKTVYDTLCIHGPMYPNGFACVSLCEPQGMWMNVMSTEPIITDQHQSMRFYETSRQSGVYWHIESTNGIPKCRKLASYKLARGFSMQFLT